jgi:hypothetical protein
VTGISHVPEHIHVRPLYGSIEQLGTLRVNGAAATLDTPVTASATILIIPKVECGSR